MAPMWHRNIVAFDHNKKKYAENGRTFLFNLPFWNKSGPVPIFGHAISPCAVPLWQTLAVKWLPCDLGIFRVYVTIANNIACIIEGSYSPMAARFMEANSLSICLFKLRILAKKTFLGHVGFSLRLTFLFFSSSIFLGPLIKCYTRLNTIQCKSTVMVFFRTHSCSCAGAQQRRYLIFSLNPLEIK